MFTIKVEPSPHPCPPPPFPLPPLTPSFPPNRGLPPHHHPPPLFNFRESSSGSKTLANGLGSTQLEHHTVPISQAVTHSG